MPRPMFSKAAWAAPSSFSLAAPSLMLLPLLVISVLRSVTCFSTPDRVDRAAAAGEMICWSDCAYRL